MSSPTSSSQKTQTTPTSLLQSQRTISKNSNVSESSGTDSANTIIRGKGNTNIAAGSGALHNSPPNMNSVALGCDSAYNCISKDTTAIGFAALRSLVNSTGNSAVGAYALTRNTHPDNTALGYRVCFDTNAPGNTAIGSFAMLCNDTGRDNTCVGTRSILSNTSGSRNSALGYESLYGCLNGDDNTVFGHYAQKGSSSLSRVTAIGSSALTDNLTSDNVAIGYFALRNNQTGQYNTSVGTESLETGLSGNNNTAMGYRTFRGAWGNDNTGLGSNVMNKSTTTGSENTGIGSHALQFCSGSKNTALGFKSQNSVQMGHSNVSIGHLSLQKCINGTANTVCGTNAGTNILSGQNNTAVGYQSGPSSEDISDSICIGSGSKAEISGELSIGSMHHPVNTTKHVGDAGNASKLPLSPQDYLKITLNGEQYVIPLYRLLGQPDRTSFSHDIR